MDIIGSSDKRTTVFKEGRNHGESKENVRSWHQFKAWGRATNIFVHQRELMGTSVNK